MKIAPKKIQRFLNSKTIIKENKNGIQIRDIFLTVTSALLVVLINQFFFEPNKIREAQIEINKENLRLQTPALNRILALTNKYEYSTIIYYTFTERQEKQLLEKIKTNIVKGGKTNMMKDVKIDLLDSVVVSVPSFVINEKKRARLIDDIAAINKYRDNLEPEIYILVDKLLDMLDENGLPELDNKEEIIKSSWNKKAIQESWDGLLIKMRLEAKNKLDEFYGIKYKIVSEKINDSLK